MKFELIGLTVAAMFAMLGAALALLGQEGQLLWSARADETVQQLLAAIGITYIISVVIAIFQISGAAQSHALKQSLCSPAYRPVYDRWASWALSKARDWADVPQPDASATTWQLLKGAFTYPLLDRAMLLAVVYPILSFLLFWGLTGRPGTLGQVTVIEPADPYWKGLAAVVCIALTGVVLLGVRQLWRSWQFLRTKFAEPLDLVILVLVLLAVFQLGLPPSSLTGTSAGVGAIFLLFKFRGVDAIALAAAVSVAAAIAGIFVGANAGLTANGMAGGLAGVGLSLVAGLTATAAKSLYEKEKIIAACCIAVLGPATIIVASLGFLPWEHLVDDRPVITAILLFFAVAPLVNAVFDYLSYAITLAFAERGRRGLPIVWGLLDSVVALALFLSLGTALVAVCAGMKRASGAAFVDLGSLLAEAGDFAQYWWLYLMLFSTALPTGLHLFLAGISLQACVPMGFRNSLCDQIDRARAGGQRASAVAPLQLGLIWTSGIVVVFGTLFGLVQLFWNYGVAAFLSGYRDWLVQVAIWVGGF